jgi:2-oxoglutarate dehydrogenase E1 component
VTATPDEHTETAIASEAFGPNTWLVEQMYHRYLTDPAAVSPAWREFFAGYRSAHAAVTPPPQRETATPIAPPPAVAPSPAVPAAEGAAPDDLPDYAVPAELRGAGAAIARRMEDSRALPTATSVRTFPAKLLEVNRRILNNQLARRTEGGKVSFTHLIGWAVVQAMREQPAMNAAYREIDGKPHRISYEHINLGLAMDMARADGSRTLLVPNIKGVDAMTFHEYWQAYEAVVNKARSGAITPDDFAGTTATLTNPGTVGTIQSVPRLMPGQGVIVGVGRIGFPPEYEGADPVTIAAAGIGRTLTMTSTYDHRIIQGAESGMFLARIHALLLGDDGFYDEIFRSMQVPYVPARWAVDANPPAGSRPWAEKQARVFQLINQYRVRGHLIADLDPLRQNPPAIHPELDPLTYGLTLWDLDREFATGGLAGKSRMKLGEILGVLRDAYCRTTGIEYMHIQEPDQKVWIQQHVEQATEPLSGEEKRRVLLKLNEAEAFERFLHTKFLGAKRFSLEGSESLIPLLDATISAAADAGMEGIILGMAHRGRLNVLANIIGKSLVTIFREFYGDDHDDPSFSGDVKYHLGARGVHKTAYGTTIDIELAANPSHLEAVDPVVEGITRARQELRGEGADDLVMPLLIHGDAAFSGQGVVAETFNLSQLEGYATGGTVHIVVNNQVGFTATAEQSRSSHYATDVAKMVQAPIFHVNADDPEAVVRIARLAFAFRQAFHKDVVIDMVAYRRLGHNEGDEPTYTQPKMYRIIEQQRSVRHLYLERLVAGGDMTLEEGEAVLESFRTLLDQALADTQQPAEPAPRPTMLHPEAPFDTRVPAERLAAIERSLATLPDGFTVHPKLVKTLEERHRLFAEGHVDWAMGEALALGSLALEGVPVRLAGEDSQRGTFSHRHAVLVDYHTEEEYTPLYHLNPEQAPLRIYDSLLSEFAAMGFEYGYTIGNPEALVMWEAQFGDFVNGAQVIIDQFVTSGMDKWGQSTSLVLLLPHGFEGQGPEHSSARLERFLTNAAEQNVRVAVPSTPAQYFHLLRKQATHPAQRPLIVMTPKSLLRTRASFSPVAMLHDMEFQRVIPDPEVTGKVRRVLLCTGKIYYELVEQRTKLGVDDVAVVRVELLYPFPGDELNRVLSDHGAAELVWVQEEPANMGAWRFMSRNLHVEAGRSCRGIYRRESPSPATGNPQTHVRQQQAILDAAFAD